MAKKRDYGSWSKEDLIREIEVLRKQKTYGLVWEKDNSKTKEVFDYYINWDGVKNKETFKEAGDKFPVLKEVKGKEITTEKSGNYSLLIEGDNYHSLAVLNFTHERNVDLIYIDPPYNTGNKDFKYNDAWVDREDSYRHSKWLSFMEKRLKLSRNLLKEDGAIFISIDDNELYPLKLLCDQIFLEKNYIRTIVWKKKTGSGTHINQIFDEHEYILVYAKNIDKTKSWRFKDASHGNFKNPDNDPRGPWESCAITAPSKNRNPNQLYCMEIYMQTPMSKIKKETTHGEAINIFEYDGKTIVFRKVSEDKQISEFDETNNCYRFVRRWSYIPESMLQIFKQKKVYLNNSNIPRYKKFKSDYEGKALPSIYPDEFSTQDGSEDLKTVLPNTKMDYPKPVNLIEYIIAATTNSDSLVLDFFAGSGTTGEAILRLNKKENAARKFILCTNDEGGIMTEVCYPRLEKITNGYATPNGEKVDGLGGNIKYFKTDFVESAPTDKNKKKIVDKSAEMICIRENAFEPLSDSGMDFKIFKNHEINLGIVFNADAIDDFVKEAKKIAGKFHVYVFSLDDTVPEYEFRELTGKLKLCAIPDAILHVYRRVLKND